MLNLNLFTETEGIFLIRLLLAHLIADFLLQSKKMVENKKWISNAMFIHIFIVFIITFLFCQNLLISIIISILHYITDGFKIQLSKNKKIPQTLLFIADQLIHILAILIRWSIYFNINDKLTKAFLLPFTDFNLSLLLFSYLLISNPFGYFIGLTTKRFQNQNNNETKTDKMHF